MSSWVSNYGKMRGLLSDIGGEMSNKILDDVAAKLIIKTTTTAAYSQHQNGLNERNHCMVGMMMVKIKESDPDLSPEMCLRWAGKSTGGNKYWWNVKDMETGEEKLINTKNLEALEIVAELEPVCDKMEEAC